jgi:arginase family enzyme
VGALSTVADVMATGSLEDLMAAAPTTETPEEAAASAHHVREVMTAVLAGFVDVVEENHPDDEEVAAAKAEISQLAELLAS